MLWHRLLMYLGAFMWPRMQMLCYCLIMENLEQSHFNSINFCNWFFSFLKFFSSRNSSLAQVRTINMRMVLLRNAVAWIRSLANAFTFAVLNLKCIKLYGTESVCIKYNNYTILKRGHAFFNFCFWKFTHKNHHLTSGIISGFQRAKEDRCYNFQTRISVWVCKKKLENLHT